MSEPAMSDATMSGAALDKALLDDRPTAPIPGHITTPPVILFPERAVLDETRAEMWLARLQSFFVPLMAKRRMRKLWRIVPLVHAAAESLRRLDDATLIARTAQSQETLRALNRFEIAATAECFAIVREWSGRLRGQRHHDVQIVGAFAMLNGMLAEMATGEGKTLTATLTACVAALAGFPVHVITVNDYLASRDAEQLLPLYTRLGLSVGTAVTGQSTAERQAAYRCDVVYCTNKELAFDYLRDRITLGQSGGNLRLKLEKLHTRRPRSAALRMRGLHFAIIDEADSVLIDEARTPLIISAPTPLDVYSGSAHDAIAIAAALEEQTHFELLRDQNRVVLTRAGQDAIIAATTAMSPIWRSSVTRDELAMQALAALHLYQRDEHYLVRDDAVCIIDEYTGRTMPDRKWSSGLHQMIEAKERCALSENRTTIARITYQKLFRRYGVASGMSGTLQTTAREIWFVYRLAIAAIPTHRPLRRTYAPDRVFATEAEKWRAVVTRVASLHADDIPVLLGTRSVAASQTASALLAEAGLPHVVLNASQDKHEAEIVAQAGQCGRITIATNMAARGTDIKIAAAALQKGGLHVIMTERHDARRIDDQLAGRCARQGEVGRFEAFLSLEDPLMTATRPRALDRLMRKILMHRPDGAYQLITRQQRNIERLHSGMRADLLRSDQSQSKLNAFTGQGE